MDEPLPPVPPVLPAAPAVSSDDKLWAIGCHLSIFLGVALLLPLIVYLVKREQSAWAAAHAREALNFHLSLLIYSVAFVPSFFLFSCLSLLAWPVIALFAIIAAIVAAVRAGEGGFFKYPLTIPFVS